MKMTIIEQDIFEVDGYVVVFDGPLKATVYDGADRECRVGYVLTVSTGKSLCVEAEHYPETEDGVLEEEVWEVRRADGAFALPLCAAQFRAIEWLVEQAEARFSLCALIWG